MKANMYFSGNAYMRKEESEKIKYLTFQHKKLKMNKR